MFQACDYGCPTPNRARTVLGALFTLVAAGIFGAAIGRQNLREAMRAQPVPEPVPAAACPELDCEAEREDERERVYTDVYDAVYSRAKGSHFNTMHESGRCSCIEDVPCEVTFCPAPNPTSCSEPRAGETAMFTEILSHRAHLEDIDPYNLGASDMLRYIEAFQRIEQWGPVPYAPEPDLELLGHSLAMLGWDNASDNWWACCEDLLEVWPNAEPLDPDFPTGFPAYCK